MTTPIVAAEPVRVTTLVPVDASAEQNSPRFVLAEATGSGVTSRSIAGVDADHYDDAYLRQLVEYDGDPWLVLASSSQVHVYRIDEDAADLVSKIEPGDNHLLKAVVSGEQLVLVGFSGIHVAHARHPTEWRSVPFDGAKLLDARPGKDGCVVDALMRSSAGWGLFCVNAKTATATQILSLEGYGLKTADMPLLVDGVADSLAVLGWTDTGQIALLCDVEASQCAVAQLSDPAYPTLESRRSVVAVPGTHTAITARVADGDATLFAHDLAGGVTKLLSRHEGTQPDAAAQGWGGIVQARVVAAGQVAVVLLFNYTGALVTQETGTTAVHGVSVRPVVVTAQDVADAFGADAGGR